MGRYRMGDAGNTSPASRGSFNGRHRLGTSLGWLLRHTGEIATAVFLAAAGPALAQQSDILPATGALALAGNCDLTLDGAVYAHCECRMLVSAAGGQFLLSGLNVGCEGQAAAAGALSSQIGATGRTVQVLYEQGPTTAGGSGMWLTSSSASVGNVVADVEDGENWLLMTIRLLGPTHFENDRGKACVNGATGARC